MAYHVQRWNTGTLEFVRLCRYICTNCTYVATNMPGNFSLDAVSMSFSQIVVSCQGLLQMMTSQVVTTDSPDAPLVEETGEDRTTPLHLKFDRPITIWY